MTSISDRSITRRRSLRRTRPRGRIRPTPSVNERRDPSCAPCAGRSALVAPNSLEPVVELSATAAYAAHHLFASPSSGVCGRPFADDDDAIPDTPRRRSRASGVELGSLRRRVRRARSRGRDDRRRVRYVVSSSSRSQGHGGERRSALERQAASVAHGLRGWRPDRPDLADRRRAFRVLEVVLHGKAFRGVGASAVAQCGREDGFGRPPCQRGKTDRRRRRVSTTSLTLCPRGWQP